MGSGRVSGVTGGKGDRGEGGKLEVRSVVQRGCKDHRVDAQARPASRYAPLCAAEGSRGCSRRRLSWQERPGRRQWCGSGGRSALRTRAPPEADIKFDSGGGVPGAGRCRALRCRTRRRGFRRDLTDDARPQKAKLEVETTPAERTARRRGQPRREKVTTIASPGIIH